MSFSFGKVAPKAIDDFKRNYFYNKITPTVEAISTSVNRTVGSNFIYTRGENPPFQYAIVFIIWSNLENRNWDNFPSNHNTSILNICNKIVFQQKTKKHVCVCVF